MATSAVAISPNPMLNAPNGLATIDRLFGTIATASFYGFGNAKEVIWLGHGCMSAQVQLTLKDWTNGNVDVGSNAIGRLAGSM